MKIDPTPTQSGGPLVNSDVETIDIVAELSPAPAVLAASVAPTTVSISHIFIDSKNPEAGPDPDEPDDPTLFYGRASVHFGFGGAPEYTQCYPLSGYPGTPTSSVTVLR